ncbi:MAG: DNA-directed RNA polymerase subunit alpha C-terminal domain-containing protein [Lentisphaerota bacterium]
MFSVPAISRQIIDSWSIHESGLPTRVVNCLKEMGINSIGGLRALSDDQLLKQKSLGRISLDHIHVFYQLCANLEQGRQAFANIRDVLSIFFDTDEWNVMMARYGLQSEGMALKPSYATLQAIGTDEHKTRERVRQIQEIALQKLSSRLASACLHPFFKAMGWFIKEHDTIVSGDELTELRGAEWLSSFNPASILVLLSELPGAGFQFYSRCLSTLSIKTLSSMEQDCVRILHDQARPVLLEDLIHMLPSPPGLDSDRQVRKVVHCLLAQNEKVACTLDSRFFELPTGIQPFLIELIRDLKRPAHYRAVTEAYNNQVKPHSRKGSGFILDLLNAQPQFTRVDRGIYDLKA